MCFIVVRRATLETLDDPKDPEVEALNHVTALGIKEAEVKKLSNELNNLKCLKDHLRQDRDNLKYLNKHLINKLLSNTVLHLGNGKVLLRIDSSSQSYFLSIRILFAI